MKRDNLKEIVRLVNDTINNKLNESLSKAEIELVKKAIIHVDGASYTDKVTKVHDEANNYAYQVNGKPIWFTVSRKEVDDFIKWHGKKLQSESTRLTEANTNSDFKIGDKVFYKTEERKGTVTGFDTNQDGEEYVIVRLVNSRERNALKPKDLEIYSNQKSDNRVRSTPGGANPFLRNGYNPIYNESKKLQSESTKLTEMTIPDLPDTEIHSIIKKLAKFKQVVTVIDKTEYLTFKIKDPKGNYDYYHMYPNGDIRLQSGSWNHGSVDKPSVLRNLNWVLVNLMYSSKNVPTGDIITFKGKNYRSNDGILFVYTGIKESKLTESSIPPFPNKREAMLAIQDVMDGSMTQKNFINQLAAAKRAGTIDEKNFKLILGQLRMDAKSAGVKLEPIIDRLIDKYHSGSDVFNPNLGESVDGGWKNTFVYRKSDKKKFKVIDFKNYGSYQELFLKSNDGETDEVTLGHPMDKKGFMQTYTVKESRKLTENSTPESTKMKWVINSIKNIKGIHGMALEKYLDRFSTKYDLSAINSQEDADDMVSNKRKAKQVNEAPIAPVATPTKPAAPAPVAVPVAPVEQGVDPAWKLDMIDFIGNSFQGQAKQFLYQAKKSNPKATPDQITAMITDLIKSNQIVELFKTRFLTSIKAAL